MGQTARTAITPTPGTLLERRAAKPSRVLAVASLGVALALLDATIVNIAFPDIRADFTGTDLDALSWVLNAYNIVFAAFLIPAGRIADLLGRKKLFWIGMFVFTFASALCAAAPSVGTLVAARVIQALGSAIVVPTSLALVLDAFRAEERSRAVTIWAANAVLAAGIGPTLGGVLVELGGWRLAFLINLPIGIGGLYLTSRVLVESRAPGRRQLPDLGGAVLLALGVSSLVFGIVKGGEWGWADTRVVAAFAAAAALGALFVLQSRRHRSPLLDPALLRTRSVAVANAFMMIAASGFFAYILANVLFLTGVWGYSVLQAGLAGTPGPLVGAVVARPADALAERLGHRLVIVLGTLIWACGLIFLIQAVGVEPNFLGEWLPAVVILGIGGGIAFPVVSSIAVAHAPGGRFATASGLNSISRQIGAALGVAILVAVVGTPTPAEALDAFHSGWTFSVICMLAAAVAALLIGRVPRAEAPEDELPAPPPRIPQHRAAQPTVVAASDMPPPQTGAEALARSTLFGGLDADSIEDLASRCTQRALQAGEWLFKRGDPPRSLYVLESGRLDVVLEGDGQESEELLNVLQPGEVLGELALLSGEGRSASVRARRDSRVLELKRSDFDSLLHSGPLREALLASLATQLQRSRAVEPDGALLGTTLAVVPAVPGGGGLAGEVATLLARALGEHGTVAVLEGAPENPAGSLERLEREHDRVVLGAAGPDEGGAWRAFCVRQADRVVVVASGEPPGSIDDSLRGCDLLLEREQGETMAAWVDALQPRARYVLGREQLQVSVEAVARRLAGRSVGLVLSGGGARAFAHIGALEELEAFGLEIDRVAGVDVGAMIAGMYAAGMSVAEIDARCYEEWVRYRPMGDYAFPRNALTRGRRLQEVLERNLPGRIEELPREFACVAADLHTGEEVAFRRGPLAGAVAASLDLPGIGPPRRDGDRLLVDGLLVTALPVHLLDRAEGPLIAVDVTAGEGPQPSETGELPGIAETLVRAVLIGGVDGARSARETADLVISPPSEGVGLLEWHQLDTMRDAGRRATADALRRSPRSLGV